MTPLLAGQLLCKAIEQALTAGLVVSGEIHITRPRTPGLCRADAVIHDEDDNTVRLVVHTAPAGLVAATQAARESHTPTREPPQLDGLLEAVADLPQLEVEGEICWKCGSPNMKRVGPCLACLDCGETSGGCG